MPAFCALAPPAEAKRTAQKQGTGGERVTQVSTFRNPHFLLAFSSTESLKQGVLRGF